MVQEIIFAVGGVALFILAAGGVLAAQWRHHRRKEQVPSWLLLQLLSPPLAVASYYAGQFPAGRVEGMGALGIAMVGLVTITPLVYFGGHLLIGKILGGPEGLSVGESMAVAATTLALAGGALALYGSIGQSFRQARSEVRRAGIERTEHAPIGFFRMRLPRSPHDPNAQRRYAFSPPVPGGETSVALCVGPSPGANTASITFRAKRADTVAGPPPISIPTATASKTSS